MRSRREALCKILNKWKSFCARCLFFGAAQIEERFLALLGMTTRHAEQEKKKKKGAAVLRPLQNNER